VPLDRDGRGSRSRPEGSNNPVRVGQGKVTGQGGAKIGNAHLKWAFSEAALMMLRHSEHARIPCPQGDKAWEGPSHDDAGS
jgi:hypothetical protein